MLSRKKRDELASSSRAPVRVSICRFIEENTVAARAGSGPMQIKLSEEASARIIHATRQFFNDDLDSSLSDFQAERVIEFFLRQLGAPVYNQAIGDARAFLQAKLDDLDGEFYEPETSG
jgi:uncharacterized protein (DUF2164 family)